MQNHIYTISTLDGLRKQITNTHTHTQSQLTALVCVCGCVSNIQLQPDSQRFASNDEIHTQTMHDKT